MMIMMMMMMMMMMMKVQPVFNEKGTVGLRELYNTVEVHYRSLQALEHSKTHRVDVFRLKCNFCVFSRGYCCLIFDRILTVYKLLYYALVTCGKSTSTVITILKVIQGYTIKGTGDVETAKKYF